MKSIKSLLVFSISLFLCINVFGVNLDTVLWKTPSSKLKSVFVNEKNKNCTEILKLYKDQSYEYISYTIKNNNCIMKRDVGNYDLKGNKLKLERPKIKPIRSEIYLNTLTYVSGKGIYSSKLKSIFQRNNYLMAEKKKTDYDFPFYLNPINKTIVNNPDAINKIDLKDVVFQITKNKKTEHEKMMAIIHFIHASIEYDYPGYRSRKYANSQYNSKQILAGKNRLAVCAGYAHIFNEFCKLAGINCKEVIGYAKNSEYTTDKDGGRHAWNKVTINGNEELYDITWADDGDSRWLNVKPDIMIYTHFPDDVKDQLLLNPISKEHFRNSPYIIPKSINYSFTDFYPKSSKVFCDSVFVFSKNGTINNLQISEIDGEYFNVTYSADAKKSQNSYDINYVTNFKRYIKDDKTIIEVPINKNISCITITADGCSYTYKVIKGTLNQLYSSYQKNANKNNLDSYIKAVVASIALNDAKTLTVLAGINNPLFFEKSGKIKERLLDNFKNWDGSINEIVLNKVNHTFISIHNHVTTRRDSSYMENIAQVGSHNLIFDKKGDDYAISKIE